MQRQWSWRWPSASLLLPRLLLADGAPLVTPSLVADALVKADFAYNSLSRGSWTAGAPSGGNPTGVATFRVFATVPSSAAQVLNLQSSEMVPQWLKGGVALSSGPSVSPFPTLETSFCFWMRFDADNFARSGKILPQAPLLSFACYNQMTLSWESTLQAFMYEWKGVKCMFKPEQPLLVGQWAQVALVHPTSNQVTMLFNGAQVGAACSHTNLNPLFAYFYTYNTLLLSGLTESTSSPLTAMGLSQFIWWQRAVAHANITAMYQETTPYLTANAFPFVLQIATAPAVWLPPYAAINVPVMSPLPKFGSAGSAELTIASSPAGAISGPTVLTFVDATLGESVPIQSFIVQLDDATPTATISSNVTAGDVGHLLPFPSFTVNRHSSFSSFLAQALIHVNITASTPRQIWSRFVASPPANPLGLGYFHMDGHFQHVDVLMLGAGTPPAIFGTSTGWTIAVWARVHTWLTRVTTEQPIWAMQSPSNEALRVVLNVSPTGISFLSGPLVRHTRSPNGSHSLHRLRAKLLPLIHERSHTRDRLLCICFLLAPLFVQSSLRCSPLAVRNMQLYSWSVLPKLCLFSQEKQLIRVEGHAQR